MHKGLLRTLTYMYQFITLGRDQLRPDQVNSIAAGSRALVETAPQVLDPEDGDGNSKNALDLSQAEIVEQHIEEMAVWITHLEIV